MKTAESLTLKRVFWFWAPLATMWLFMSAEQPSITAVVSRLPDAVQNLAAFGLTFSLALIVESPVVMLLTAATALATHRQSYRRLVQFTHVLALAMTGLHLLLGVTPLYEHLLRDWIGAPEMVVAPSRSAFLLMTPWTAMIAYRRLMEGIMIRYGHPQRVTLVILARLSATVLVLIAGLLLDRWPGASVAGAALSVGVTVGAITAAMLARPTIAREIAECQPGQTPLGWRRLTLFYIPLALSSLIMMVAQPILSFGLSHAARPLESLAVWPVVMSLLFIGRSAGIAYQEVVVALLAGWDSYVELRRFAWLLAVGSTLFFLGLVLTPGATLWYRHVAGLTPALLHLAITPTAIVALVPGLNALIAWQRAVLVFRQTTSPISVGVLVNVATLVALMALVFVVEDLPGANLAAGAMSASMAAECLFLAWQLRPRARLSPAGGAAG